MRLAPAFISIAVLLLSTAASAATPERRCGWIVNPTPANWWLYDRDGEWTISTQGGPQASGVDLPDFSTHDWVVTNSGDHGYGCACLTAVYDHRTMTVTRILAATQRTLGQCRADKALRMPE